MISLMAISSRVNALLIMSRSLSVSVPSFALFSAIRIMSSSESDSFFFEFKINLTKVPTKRDKGIIMEQTPFRTWGM